MEAFFQKPEELDILLEHTKPVSEVSQYCFIPGGQRPKIILQKSTCAFLKAAIMQNIAKFKSMEVSGIIGFKCARHDFFLPGAVVDLTKGER